MYKRIKLETMLGNRRKNVSVIFGTKKLFQHPFRGHLKDIYRKTKEIYSCIHLEDINRKTKEIHSSSHVEDIYRKTKKIH